MAQEQLKAKKRKKLGKGASHRLRENGYAPGVVYGPGREQPLHIEILRTDLESLLRYEAGELMLVELEIEDDGKSEKCQVLLREVQHNPLKRRIIHADFLQVSMDKAITIKVPLRLVGSSAGEKAGGIVEHALWDVEIEALPDKLPPHIDVDITNLEVGHSLHVRDIIPAEGVTIRSDPDQTVVSITLPAAEIAAVAEAGVVAEEMLEGEEEIAEPEVISEKKTEQAEER